MAERKPTGSVTFGDKAFPYAPMTIGQMADVEPIMRRQQAMAENASLRERLQPMMEILQVMLVRFTPDLTVDDLWALEVPIPMLQEASTKILSASGYVPKDKDTEPGEADAPEASTSTRSMARSPQAAASRRSK